MALTEGEFAQLRADADALLLDRCRVVRPIGRGELNQVTAKYDGAPPAVLIFEGPCWVAPLGLQDREVVFGEEAVDVVGHAAKLPSDAPELRKGDLFEVVETHDPRLLGRVLKVHSSAVKTLQVGRRVILRETRDE